MPFKQTLATVFTSVIISLDKLNAFILPPQIILPVLTTDLEGIITGRAIVSSIITNLRNEISGDRLLIQLSDIHPTSFVYVSIALTFIYGQWKFYEGHKSFDKFQKLETYVEKEKVWKNIILIIMYVFTKDVMSVS